MFFGIKTILRNEALLWNAYLVRYKWKPKRRHNLAEILLMLALKTNQSINQSKVLRPCDYKNYFIGDIMALI